jgi:hypothetical protein
MALVYTTLKLDIPPLESGTYVIEAGDLVDTLVVGSPAPRPGGKFFAARGRIVDVDGLCTMFGAPGSCPGAEEVSGILAPFVLPPPAPPKPWNVRLTGTVVGADSCGGREFHSLVARSLRLEELPQPGI